MRRRLLKNKPAARIKLRLSTRWFLVGTALMVLVCAGLFFFYTLSSGPDAQASTRILAISRTNGAYTTNSTWLRSGSLLMPQPGDSTSIRHAVTAGSLTITNQPITINSGGSLTTTSNLTLDNGAIMTITNSTLIVNGILTVRNGARLVLNGGSVTVTSNVVASGSGGTIDILSGTMQVGGTTQITAGNSRLINRGTFNSGALTVDGGGTIITNTGTISVTGYTTVNTVFNNAGNFTTTGDLAVTSSGRMNNQNPGDIQVNGRMNVTSGGYYTISGGTMSVINDVTVGGGSYFTMTNGQATFNKNMTVTGGSVLNMQDGNIDVANTVSFNNSGHNTISGELFATNVLNNSTMSGRGLLGWSGTFTSDWGNTIIPVSEPYITGKNNIPPYNPYDFGVPRPLPVRLISFSAQSSGSEVILNWSTASEENNDFYTIERSPDANNFTPIQTVKGSGSSNQKITYRAVDKEPLAGIAYYRLRQTDYDGVFSLSKTVSVEGKPRVVESFKMYPNPANVSQPLTIELPAEATAITMINKKGEVVLKQLVKASSSPMQIDLARYSADVYIVKVQVGSNVQVQKLVVN